MLNPHPETRALVLQIFQTLDIVPTRTNPLLSLSQSVEKLSSKSRLKTLTFAESQTLSIRQKVQEVEEAFSLLSQEMATFQGWSGLNCKAGCGRCCTKADIEATVLEFLPFAYHVFRNGEAENWLKRLEEHPDTICLFFKPNQLGFGLCSQYQHRGLICRLFGFSARTNKYGQREFVTCQTVKAEQSENYQLAVEKIREGEFIPVMNHHYMRLVAIDPQLARDFYPINKAIKLAIETVLHYYAYRDETD